MASIPVNGYPAAPFFTPPGRRKDSKGHFMPKGQILMMVGTQDLEEGFKTWAKNAAGPFRLSALNEIGLFGESETKIRTPVEYGVLRASIGHWTPEDVKDSGAMGPEEGPTAAVWELSPLSVSWGTSVQYAPWIEDGFTMKTRRAVWFDDVQGFRMVNPFSYRGAHMFAQAVHTTELAVPAILSFWMDYTAKKSEMK